MSVAVVEALDTTSVEGSGEVKAVDAGFVVVEAEFGEEFAESNIEGVEFCGGPVDDAEGIANTREGEGGVCLGELMGR